jgi:hypothetical protein
MMRSWEARGDTAVVDEPLYACYLAATGIEHPGRPEILARHETRWPRVIQQLTGPVSGDLPIHYQKHMAHHLLPCIDRSWLATLTNCFLIRAPREMLVSLAKVIPEPSLEATGLPQQVELFERVHAETGRIPPVVDARDVLEDPPRLLEKLCTAIGVPFRRSMLQWEPGPRDTDGVWARHWYAAVEHSTGFAPYRGGDVPVPDALRRLIEPCEALYATLAAHRIT